MGFFVPVRNSKFCLDMNMRFDLRIRIIVCFSQNKIHLNTFKSILSSFMSFRISLRSTLRTIRARTPFKSKGPRQLTLRFGKRDHSIALGIGKKRSLAHFQSLIADCVQHGTGSVHFIVDDEVLDSDIPLLIRFAHRLGCSTEVVLSGKGITESVAQQFLLSGVDWVWMLFGGVSASVHMETVGVSIEESTRSLQNLLELRKELELEGVRIGLLLPWQNETPSQSTAIKDWSLELGVDSVQPHFPYFGKDMSTEPLPHHQHLNRLLQFVWQDDSDEPGWKRRYPWSCPVGTNRLEVSKYGRVCACPHKSPIVWNQESLSEIWSNLTNHRQEIKDCERVCLHRDLRFL